MNTAVSVFKLFIPPDGGREKHMKIHLKIISVCLAVLFLAAALAGCKKEGNQTNTGVNNSGNGTTAVTTESDPYKDDLPDGLNYGDTVINLICPDKMGVSDEFKTDGESSNIVSTAVYHRNLAVEERLGVKLNIICDTDAASEEDAINKKVDVAVSAGDDSYDIVAAATYVAARYIFRGSYRNLYDCENLNLEKSYWSKGFNEIFSYGDNTQYIATGSAAISIYRLMYVTIYNKQMFTENHQEDLYEIAKNGEWTIERQTELSKVFYSEAGDDSVYGVSTGTKISVDPYWVAFQCNIISKDSDNKFQLNNDSATLAKVSSAVDLLKNLYTDASTKVFLDAEDGFTVLSKTIEPFYEQKAAMATCLIYAIESNMKNLAALDYGIVPMPKYDKDQEEYYSAIQDQVTSFGIAKTVTDSKLAMMGAVLECIASESYDKVVDAYYGTALSGRYLQNEESQEMLKIVYEGSCMAMAAVYTGVLLPSEGFTTFMRNIVKTAYNTSANVTSSEFRRIKKSLESGIGSLNSNFESID